MDPISSEQLILESGKSADLKATFQAILTGVVNGQPRFTPDTGKKLGLAIACRNYAFALLELSHMVYVAQACESEPGQFESLFWDSGPARAAHFRFFLQKHLNKGVVNDRRCTLTGQGVEIRYPDGQFTVNFNRMPFLTALMEFLLTAGGYDTWGEPFHAMLASPASVATTSACAASVAKHLHHFLNDHLPTAHDQRKFQRLIRFMVEHKGKNFSTTEMDDETILAFWLSESGKTEETGTGFLTFRVVVSSFMDLFRSLEQAWQVCQLDSAVPLDSHNEGGGKDEMEEETDLVLHWLEGAILAPETVDSLISRSECSPLQALREPPMDEIGWINHAEAADLLFCLEHHRPALNMPLSVWRCEVFCPAQKRIGSQAGRNNREELPNLIHGSVTETYEQRHQVLHKRLATLDRMLYATLYALVKGRHMDVIHLILSLKPDINMKGFRKIFPQTKGTENNVVSLPTHQIADRFYNLLADPEVSGPGMTQLLTQAKQAFAKINRQGFNEADLDRPSVIDGFAQGAPHLQTVVRQVMAYLEQITRRAPTEEDRQWLFEQDREIFSRQFQKLYEGDK